jgi:tripartite-type tricarboxylate transporter receptor subunit TctC
MSRIKTVLGFAVGFAMLFANGAQAQGNYPNRPIRIIVPYPAGGIVDMVARAVTEQVGRDWKQTVVIEARPGGNSNIGTSAVARSEPDGYTWLVTGPAALVNPTLYKDAGWDALKDQMRRPRGLESKRRGRAPVDARQDHRRIR